nr:MAG TPA: hypothetical protein [Caudoviricetes sp.]
MVAWAGSIPAPGTTHIPGGTVPPSSGGVPSPGCHTAHQKSGPPCNNGAHVGCELHRGLP